MDLTIKRFGPVTAALLLAGMVGYIAQAETSRAQDVLQSPHALEPDPDADLPSDAEIRDFLVKESIERYTGPCACPYHRQFNEKLFRFPNQFRNHPTVRCGDSSAYIRPGGQTVFCYPADVPLEMVEEYREHLRATFLTEPLPKF